MANPALTSDVIDVIVNANPQKQGAVTVSSSVTGEHDVIDPVVNNVLDVSNTGRVMGKYKDAFDDINYYQ